ncbi:TolB family protein [Paenibacillus sp. MMO-58]|uniref:TolB family protein n=1 Tax=Paenibacillus sp. MMO-58 TaxID=3081290 RepID=UPI00301682ED
MDVVVVKPKEQTYSLYPVADLIVKDDYSVDSITGAYGFTKQDQLVLVQPKKREDGQEVIQYDVVALDLSNGRMKTITANAVPDVSPSFYARGWMNHSGHLYLNSYSDGRLWSVDVLTGEVQSIGGQFKNEWPLYLVTPSPDGNLFWHEQTDSFRLYDRNGKELKVIPPTIGYHSYPAFEWSPDSRFAALSFTLSDSHDNVLGGDEAYIIAPEAIAFYDEKGDLTWDVQAKPKEGLNHVDWNGWLADGEEGVLSWYRLNRAAEGAPRKADLSYALANVATGKITKLTQAKQLEELKSPMPVIVNRTTPMLIIDREQRLYWMPEEAAQADSPFRYQLLSKPTAVQLIWSCYDYSSEQTKITRYNPVNHATSVTVFNEPLGEGLQLINDTLIVDNKMNYRWIH